MPLPAYNNTAFFDCDDTLILHQPMGHNCDRCVALRDSKVHLNDMMINQVRVHKNLGHTVVLWSMRGEWWAREVGAAVGVADAVSVYLSKPSFYYDDLEAEDWLPPRTWINPSKV